MFQPKDLWQVLTGLTSTAPQNSNVNPLAPISLLPLQCHTRQRGLNVRLHSRYWSTGLSQQQVLTCTHNTCIFRVSTVVLSPAIVTALINGVLCAVAVHIVQPDCANTLPKSCFSWGPQCCAKPKLSTNYPGIIQIPKIITDGAPFSIIWDLHTTFSVITASRKPKSHIWKDVCTKEERKKKYICMYIMTGAHATALNWMGTLLSSNIARGKLLWDVSTSRVFVRHKTQTSVLHNDFCVVMLRWNETESFQANITEPTAIQLNTMKTKQKVLCLTKILEVEMSHCNLPFAAWLLNNAPIQ